MKFQGRRFVALSGRDWASVLLPDAGSCFAFMGDDSRSSQILCHIILHPPFICNTEKRAYKYVSSLFIVDPWTTLADTESRYSKLSNFHVFPTSNNMVNLSWKNSQCITLCGFPCSKLWWKWFSIQSVLLFLEPYGCHLANDILFWWCVERQSVSVWMAN